MAAITGAMTTTNIGSGQIALDLGGRISMLEPSANPLAVFSQKADKSAVSTTKFTWSEQTPKPRFMVQSGGATNVATTVAVNAGQGAYVQQWDNVLNSRTGEQFRVDSVSTDTLTVTRGIGSTGTAMLNGDELIIIGTAQPENDTSKPSRSDVPVQIGNYTQIFRTPMEISGSAQAVRYAIQPAEWQRQQQLKGIEHAKDIEYSFLWGRKSATTPGATEVRTLGGLFSFITTNQTDAGGDLSEAEWNAALQQGLRYSDGSILVLASGTALQALQKYPASKLQVRQDESTYGINVSHFQSPFGSVNVVYHKLLEGTKYGGVMVGVDMDEIAYRYLGNDEVSRDTKLLTERQARDLDGRKDELLSEISLEVRNQRKHFVITGITS
jgi:hypothetical protein